MLPKNYKLTNKLCSSEHFELFLAETLDTNTKLFIKTTKELYTKDKELKKLQAEYEKLSKIEHPYIIKVLKLEKIENKYHLIFEYFDGKNLKYAISNSKFTLTQFIPIAIKICEAFLKIHDANILHESISTNSIFIDSQRKNIKIVDFTQTKCNENMQNNTDIYKAPEQTNRINHEVSNLTDIYSLGIVFYEMLLGKIPYDSEDLNSISHSIVTKEFKSLNHLDKSIPKVLSNIVTKMIEKNPFDRYDSILSILIDLKKINFFLDKNLPIEDFKINQVKKDFLINNKQTSLFGRENDLEEFIKKIYTPNRNNSFFIISGNSGIGKTTFVKKVLEASKNRFGATLEIKLDNYKQNTPYKILYTKLRELTQQVLIENQSTLLKWEKNIFEILGKDAKVLYETIPELQIILGKLEDVEELNPTDTKIRFDNILFKYLQLFATKENPLCIFLDDMQWSDYITLNWLEKALLKLSNCTLIITYRKDEVEKDSPLNLLIKKIEENLDLTVYKYDLSALKTEDIKNLIDSNITIENSDEIAKVIFNKTTGNPFFIIQLLKQLLHENILYFDYDKFLWQCDIDELQSISASNNIIQLLENQIIQLSKDENKLLKIASCIGNKFDIKLLEKIFADDTQFNATLNKCVLKEWIVKDNTKINDSSNLYYSFSHDRIQQVIYSSIKNKEQALLHKKIGDNLKVLNDDIENNELLICINHYNKAKELFQAKSEKDFLAELNYKGAILARKNGDFHMSQNYMKNAISLFTNLEKKDNYSEILKNYAICEHLILNKKIALKYYMRAIENSNSNIERAYIYELIIKLYSEFSEFKEAYDIGKEALKLFDVKIPKNFNKPVFAKELIQLKLKLLKTKPMELLSIKTATDENAIIIIKLLSAILKAAYQVNPKLCVLTSMKLVSFCLKHGDTKDAVIGFMVFGVIFQGAILENHKLGYEYAMLSLEMIKKYENKILQPEVNFVCGYFGLSWLLPCALTEQKWFDSYNNGLNIGDLFHSGCAAAGIIQSMFLRGVEFSTILSQISIFEKTLNKIGAKEQLGAILSVKQAIRNLQFKTTNKDSFDDDFFNEDQYIKSLENYSSLHFAHYYYINKMITLYIHEEYEKAYFIYLQSKRFLDDSKGTIHGTEHYFYESLILSKLYKQTNQGLKKRYKKSIKQNIKKFGQYALDCPENFSARYNILKALLANMENNTKEAFAYLEKSIEIAEVYAQLNLKAIANKLLSEIYNELKQSKISKFFLDESYKTLIDWGIDSKKLNQLNQNIFYEEYFDINTLTKAAEVIVKEQKLPNLLKSLLQIVLENAGAQHAIVLLEEEGEYFIKAHTTHEQKNIKVMQNIPLEKFDNIVHNIVYYVIRTQKTIIIDDLNDNSIFLKEENALKRKVKSILCLPLILHNKVKGVIYLENNAISGIFSKGKIELLKHLSRQISISIDNALIYKNLEKKVQERTYDLDKKNEELGKQNIQLQLQNNKILELNSNIIKENEKRKKVEKDLQIAIEKLDLLATTDSLTDLKNRRIFDEILEKECSRVQRTNETLTLIMCDIDFFKLYNDYYGHLQGDDCLKEVAKVLKSNLKRPTDLVARYGGEEFGIILPNTSKDEAIIVASKIFESLRKLAIPHIKSEISSTVTISMGIATSKEIKKLTPKNLIRKADDALYKAKEDGRNQIL